MAELEQVCRQRGIAPVDTGDEGVVRSWADFVELGAFPLLSSAPDLADEPRSGW